MTNEADSKKLFEYGRAVYEKWCKPGHDKHHTHAGTHALAIKYDGKKPPHILDRDDLTDELIRTTVRRGAAMMPAFRKTEISDADLDALIYFMLEESRRRNS